MYVKPEYRSPDLDAWVGVVGRADLWGPRFPDRPFRSLRAQSPVVWIDQLGCWLVTGYREAVEVLRETQAYAINYGLQPEVAGDSGVAAAEFPYTVDPPRHGQLRGVYVGSGRLSVDSVQGLSGVVRSAAARALARWRATDLDGMRGFARPVVCETFAELCGLSTEEMDWVASIWLRDRPTEGLFFPRRLASPAQEELYEFLDAIAEARLLSPEEDFISGFVAANEKNQRMSRESLVWNLVDVILNGQAAVQGIIGLAIHAFADHPGQLARLTERPSLAVNATEEVLRLTPPVPILTRRVERDTALAGAALSKGDSLWLVVPSANRDGRVWNHSDGFDTSRSVEPTHLSFGLGVHQTPGAHLARMVLSNCLTVIGEALSRISRLGDTEFWPGGEVKVKHVPVAFRFKPA